MKSDIIIINESYEKTYFHAIRKKDCNTVDFLLKNKFVLPGVLEKNEEQNGLHVSASIRGSDKMLQLLFSYGVNINQKEERYERIPLYIAFEHKQIKNAKKLLELGANPDIKFPYNWTIAQCIIHNIPNPYNALLLVSNYSKETNENTFKLYQSVLKRYKNYEGIKELLLDPKKHLLKKKLEKLRIN